jgi:hypothetical protein
VAIPPPVRGINARDALASMAPDEAIILDNWFPRGSDIALRRGFDVHASNLPAAVETLMEYNGPSTRALFAAAGSEIYDVTLAGPVGAAVVSSLSNARWQHAMFTTSGGTFLIAVNGADAPQNFNGTAWATSPAITGVTAANLINVTSHKRRLWFVEANSSKAWYLGTEAIGGAATAFELGSVFRFGGALKAIIPVSHDAGESLDDYLAFVSSKGEVALYQGTDPNDATTWALAGMYRIGAPIGDRCYVQAGGDAAVITEDGVVSLLKAMQLDRAAQSQAAITDKLSPLFADYVRANRTRFGWQGIAYPAGNYAAFNIPQPAGQAVQLVMNVLTGAWCRFTGQNANCWSLLNNDLYFGGQTAVFKADTGRSNAGSPIESDVKTAFNYFGNRGTLKRFLMIRPSFMSNGSPSPAITLNVDFKDAPPTGTPTFSSAGAQWNVAKWNQSQWGGGRQTNQTWTATHGTGRCAAIRMQTSSASADISISSFDVLYERASGPVL